MATIKKQQSTNTPTKQPQAQRLFSSTAGESKARVSKKNPTNHLLSFKWYLKVNENANQSSPRQDSKNNISKPQCCGQEYICNAGTLQQQQQKPFARVNEVILAAERM